MNDLFGGGLVEHLGGGQQGGFGGSGVPADQGGAHGLDDVTHAGLDRPVASPGQKALTVPFDGGFMVGQGSFLRVVFAEAELPRLVTHLCQL